MPKEKPSPGKVVIQGCECGSQVYGYQPMLTISGHLVPKWLLLTCVKCGARKSEKLVRL